MRPGKRRAWDKGDAIDALSESIVKLSASVRAKIEHPSRVIKRQFGSAKMRYQDRAKNTAQIEISARVEHLVDGAPANSAGSPRMSAFAVRPKG